MKSKTTKVRRYLAAILTVLMIFQQATTSVIYASSEAAVPTVTEAPAAQTEETPEKQVEETPEEKTPTEEENEGEESAAPTEAPAENEAEPEVTVTPAAEPTATEAPAVEATATPVPEATPTEVPTAASFTTADGIASVNLTQPIPANAKFVATAQDADSDYFYNNVDAAMGAWVESNGLSVVDATAYDMHFEADGQELAVNQSATVHINFPAAILTQKPETGIQTTYYVLHIKNGTAVPAGTVNGDVNGAYSADITTDGFSPFVFVKAASEDVMAVPEGAIDLENALESIAIAEIGGEPFDSNKQYPRDAEIKFQLHYKFAENNKPTANGTKQATYTLPTGLIPTPPTGDNKIYCEGYTTGPAGEFTISAGKITFTYYEDFLKAHPSNIEGNFSFKSKISTTETENKEKITINFPGKSSTIPVVIKLEEGKISGEKTYTLNDDGTIDFKIKLTVTDKNVTDVNLKDTQGSNLDFADNPNFTIDGTPIDNSKITQSGNEVSLNLGDLTIGVHEITYKAKLKDVHAENNDNNKNTVNWTWNAGSGNTDTTVDANNLKPVLRKVGSVEKDGNGNYIITWNVYYKPTQFGTVAGKTFKDTLGAEQEYRGNYTVYYDATGSQWYVSENEIASGQIGNGKSFSYTFPETENKTSGAYKIVYQTKVTSDLSNFVGKKEFKNKIECGGSEAEGSVEINTSKPTESLPEIVKKEGQTENDQKTVKWTITVNSEKKKVENLTIVDTLQEREGKYKSDLQVKEGGIGLNKGSDYTVAYDKINEKATMTITFSKEIKDEVKIIYSTEYDTTNFYENNNSKDVHNNVSSTYTVDGKNRTEPEIDNSSAKFVKTDVVMDKQGSLSGGVATWKITVNNKEGWQRVYLPDSAATITDILPAGMEYVDSSVECSLHKMQYEGKLELYTQVSASYDAQSRELTINVPDLKGYAYAEITYQTKITSIPKDTGNGVEVTNDYISFTNSAKIGDVEKSATVKTSSKELHKTGKQLASPKNTVEYNIGVNYYGIDLLPSSDTLRLEDTLDTNLVLDPSSVKVIDMYTNEAVPFTANYGTNESGNNTMQLIIPDERALKITYRASFVSAGKEDGKTYYVSNEVKLSGEEVRSTKVQTSVKYEKVDANITGNSNEISIKKVDGKGKLLQGAEFVVKEVEPETLSDKESTVTYKVTTNESGIAKFERLSFNTLYYYQENKAPEGYIKDDTKHYFIIKDVSSESNKKYYNDLKSKIKKDTQFADLSGGQTFIVTNEESPKPETTATLSVAKTLVVESGTYNGSKEFSFILAKAENDNGESPMPIKNKITVKAGEEAGSFGNIKYTEAGEYHYTITEVVPENKIPGMTYDGNPHNVTVKVTADKSGKLSASVDYGKEGATSLTVTNTYTQPKSEGITAQIEAEKTVNGEVATGSWFHFILTPNASDDKNVAQNVTNVNGKITFAPLTYDKAGTYEYEVAEVQEVPNGYTADKRVYTAVVKVTENKETGKLKASVSYKKGEEAVEKITFANTYQAEGTTAQIEAEKTVNGEAATGNQFHFTLTPNASDDKNVAQNVTNVNGKITFAPLTYDKAGIYEYEVSEVQDGLPTGYSADTTIHKVKVEVTDTNGKLVATVIYADADKGGIVFKNTYETLVKVSKVDIISQKELAGAHIQILDKDGNVVEEWDSTDKAHTIKGLKTGEKYTLRETVAPNGYYLKADTTFTLKADGSIDKDNTTTTISKEGILLVEDTAIPTPDVPSGPTAKISKVDVTSQQELEGAKLQVIDKNGNVVDEWISGKTAHVTTELKAGETYTLRETVAPDGYLITSDTTFTLKEDGTVDESKTTTKVKDGVLLVEDTKAVSVKIGKVDATNQKELEGAHIQIVDKDGKIVDEWTSGKEPHVVNNLKPGETYTLRETVAPDRYTVTSDTTFTLKEDGTVDQTKTTATVSDKGVVLVEDNMTSVSISKVDITSQKELAGAHIQILDKDGKVVEEWDSTDKAYTVKGLKTGEKYTLRETVAPKGYKVAEDTTFQLNEDGTIDTANTTTAISDDTLLVKDEKKESKDVSVSVTKKLVTVDGTVIGAEDATYYVALYSDADCTQRVSDVLALNFKNASASTVTFTGLEKGQTYYVGECEADGTCYLANICADGTMYMVDFSDGNAVTVDNADGSTTVYFDNQFEKIPDGYYKEAELNITKKLVGSDGKAKNSNEIFYAGIFADEGFTQLSADVSQNIVPLDLAGGSEATALVNVALPESGSITLYVTEVDSNGKPVAGAASFKYDVTVDNAQVTLNDDNLSANVVITNTENSTKVTPTPGTPNTPNTPNTTGGFSGKSAVRTGDSTPIGGFIALFAAAAVIAGAAVFFKRRRKDEK